METKLLVPFGLDHRVNGSRPGVGRMRNNLGDDVRQCNTATRVIKMLKYCS